MVFFPERAECTLCDNVHLEVQVPATGIRGQISEASGSSKREDLNTCREGTGVGRMQVCVIPSE